MSALYIRDKRGTYRAVSSSRVISIAQTVANKMFERGASLTAPAKTAAALSVLIGSRQREVFGLLLLDSQHRILKRLELFEGTIDGCSVYPREVVKAALDASAAAVIAYHNHPSAVANASEADKQITQRIKAALVTVDIRVLDHVIVGSGTDYFSFAEKGFAMSALDRITTVLLLAASALSSVLVLRWIFGAIAGALP